MNLVGVLEYLDKFIEPGDYICVEDSNPLALGAGQGLARLYNDWSKQDE